MRESFFVKGLQNDPASILLCLGAKGCVAAKLVTPDSADSLKHTDFKKIPHPTVFLVSIRAILPILNTTFPSF